MPPEKDLPPNMFDYKLEYALSPIYIDCERTKPLAYATRTQTVLIVDKEGKCLFVEVDRYKVVDGKIERGIFRNEFEFTLQE